MAGLAFGGATTFKPQRGGLAFASILCHASQWRRGRTGIVRNRGSCRLPCRIVGRRSGPGGTKLESTDSPPRHTSKTARRTGHAAARAHSVQSLLRRRPPRSKKCAPQCSKKPMSTNYLSSETGRPLGQTKCAGARRAARLPTLCVAADRVSASGRLEPRSGRLLPRVSALRLETCNL